MFENFRETNFNILIGLWMMVSLSPSLAAQPPSTVNKVTDMTREIADAKTVAAELKEVMLKQQRLAKFGSISQQELRAADFKYKMAELNLLSLEFPDSNRRIAVSRAKLELDFRSKEFEMLNTLYRRGSVSEASIRRARTARDIAKLNYEATVDGDRNKLHSIRIARAKLTLARDLHARASKLFRSGVISRPDFDRVSRNLMIAEEGLLLAKKNLGIRVIQVPDSSRMPANRK
jgi:multidrug resistance efflux pump